jgi:hypothetical protein
MFVNDVSLVNTGPSNYTTAFLAVVFPGKENALSAASHAARVRT